MDGKSRQFTHWFHCLVSFFSPIFKTIIWLFCPLTMVDEHWRHGNDRALEPSEWARHHRCLLRVSSELRAVSCLYHFKASSPRSRDHRRRRVRFFPVFLLTWMGRCVYGWLCVCVCAYAQVCFSTRPTPFSGAFACGCVGAVLFFVQLLITFIFWWETVLPSSLLEFVA